jgi:hypothetical protein
VIVPGLLDRDVGEKRFQKAGSQKLVPKEWKLRTARTHSVVCSFPASNPGGIAGKGKARCNRPHGHPIP